MLSLRSAVFALVLLLAGQDISNAQNSSPDPPAQTAAGILGGPIRVSGLIDAYYLKNFNNPASRVNQLRNFDVRANSLTLNMAKLVLEHDPAPVGFRIDFGFGRAFDIFHSTEPAGDILDILPQAYASFRPRGAGGLQIDAGKFFTSAGAELTENDTNWNYSRSLIYANGPYYHSGLRVTKPLGENFTVGVQLLNGWNNVEDNNTGKTLGFTTAWTGEKVSWFQTWYTGPEKTDTNQGFRNFYDTVLTLTPAERAQFALNFDYGTEKRIGGGSDDWIALSGQARFLLTENFSLNPRLEFYYDKDGFITGTAQKIKEFTLTGEYRWAEGVMAKAEYRRDWSDVAFFERGAGGLSKTQSTVLVGIVAWFELGRR
jgi:hypothetical protein